MAKDNGSKNKRVTQYWEQMSHGVFGSAAKMQLIGNRELSIEGCKGILEYDDTVIRVNLGTCQLQLLGRGLSIPVMERSFVQIEGFITSIEFM